MNGKAKVSLTVWLQAFTLRQTPPHNPHTPLWPSVPSFQFNQEEVCLNRNNSARTQMAILA